MLVKTLGEGEQRLTGVFYWNHDPHFRSKMSQRILTILASTSEKISLCS